jgi:hypothetical protein
MLAALGLVLALGATSARADLYTFSNGTRAASADFSLSGNTLTVVLTNTSTFDVGVPEDVLTALYFNPGAGATLTKVSALLTNGSTVYYDADGQPAGGVVGGEWAYKNGISVTVGTGLGAKTYGAGISSVGLGVFGPGDLFPGPDLQSPTSPDGLQYGLLSAGDDPATGNGGITGSGGLIKNSVTFQFTVSNFNLSSLGGSVGFQYGTDLSEPSFNGEPFDPGPPVPEPSTLAIAGLGALGFVGYGIRRRRSK